jgi:hypothetical protein
VRNDSDAAGNAAFEILAGAAALAVVGLAAAPVRPAGEPVARAVLVGFAVGVLAVLVTDWRAVAAHRASGHAPHYGARRHPAGAEPLIE